MVVRGFVGPERSYSALRTQAEVIAKEVLKCSGTVLTRHREKGWLRRPEEYEQITEGGE
jgi:hypothetical protein